MLRAISTKSYDEFIQSCQNRDTFGRLKTVFQLSSSTTATLLKAYALRYYPHELMTLPITLADRLLLESATQVVTSADLMEEEASRERLGSFQERFITFVRLFDEWLLVDKARVVTPFIVKLNQLRQLRDDSDVMRPFYVTELKQLVDLSLLQLIGQINGLGGEQALARIDAERPSTPLDAEFANRFRLDCSTAFWATFRERLPSYEGVIPLLVDFIHRYMRLVPHRQDLLVNLTEVLDIEFLRQKISTRVVTLTDLRGYLRYVLDLTKRVASPAHEQQLEERFALLIAAETEAVDLLHNFFTELFQYYDELAQVTEIERNRARELFPELF